MNPKFHVGDRVMCPARQGCFPGPTLEVKGLTVTNVTLIECTSIPPYYRVDASRPDGKRVEGAEFWFEASSNE